MSQTQKPIILFTNDDGIESPGLWALVAAFRDVGRLLVAAPREQQSGMGRSLPHYSEGRIFPFEVPIDCGDCCAYSVDGTPAQAVQHAVLELAEEKPALLVSGINYGENTGNGVTISGTVGAALEAASLGIPAIAVSQQTAYRPAPQLLQHCRFQRGGGFLAAIRHLADEAFRSAGRCRCAED